MKYDINTLSRMKKFRWSHEKNKKLITERELSFETVVYFIEKG